MSRSGDNGYELLKDVLVKPWKFHSQNSEVSELRILFNILLEDCNKFDALK